MATLSGSALLHIWETAQGRHPVDRALAVLAAAFPAQALEALATLTIGQRDVRLLAVYEQNFGAQVAGLADCPDCRTTIEFNLKVADIRLAPAAEAAENGYHLTSGDYALRFRLPNSFDLAAIASADRSGAGEVRAARNLLVQRCVLESRQAEEVAVTDLPESAVAALVARMAACDPQAEVNLTFTCPECAHEWGALFDIVTFLWAKISAQARRLLGEVHTLARAYGWAEAEILALSPARRHAYLAMVI